MTETSDDFNTSFEFSTFLNIDDQTSITFSFIFLKLLNDPNVIYLLLIAGDKFFFLSLLNPI